MNDLIEALDAVAARVGGITRLQPDSADAYTRELAEIYVSDPASLRWWASQKVSAERHSCGCDDGLSQLAKLVASQNDAMLVVTDDEAPPWPVYTGHVRNIIEVLRGCRFFEYFVAAQDMSWIVFDTHMNELVSAARPAACRTGQA